MQGNPYEPNAGQVVAAPAGTITIIPKWVGGLNIVFGVIMMACGLCSGVYTMLTFQLTPLMQAQQQQMDAAMVAVREREIEKLTDAEEKAETDEEKATLREKRVELEDAPAPSGPNMQKMQAAMLPATYFAMFDIATALLLNIVMVAGGVGLIMTKEWGRLTSVIVAVLKIGRLVVIYTIFLVVILPIVCRSMESMMEEMMRQQAQMQAGPAAAPPAGTIAGVYGVMGTVCAIAMILCGSIYPAITVYLLTRERVKAVCQGRPFALDQS